jgi:hypothetical protein
VMVSFQTSPYIRLDVCYIAILPEQWNEEREVKIWYDHKIYILL